MGCGPHIRAFDSPEKFWQERKTRQPKLNELKGLKRLNKLNGDNAGNAHNCAGGEILRDSVTKGRKKGTTGLHLALTPKTIREGTMECGGKRSATPFWNQRTR
jgi:hypothetical protein